MADIDDATDATVEALWRSHRVDLVRLATMLVGPSDADDVAVEAFLRCQRVLETGVVDSARAYLVRAVVNQAHDWRRSRKRRWARDLAAVGPADVAALDTFVDVRRAISQLTLKQRAVIYFAYWEGLPERDIGELLAMSAGSVHAHLSAARTTLRRSL